MSETSIQQWGNSLAVRLPKELAHKMKLRAGSRVSVTPRFNNIIIQPLQQKKPTLQELVAKITKKNKHKLILDGPPVGKEIW